jgi:preprotein translocase subunit SecY
MLATLRDAWKIKELRNKILYTLLMLFIFRLGSFIPVPFINLDELSSLVSDDGILGLYNVISGGNFANFTIFAMSITPYINASIIMNLLTFAIPALERIAKEGEEGRKKLAQYTRYLTVALALIQAIGMSLSFSSILTENTPFNVFVVVISITAGTAFLMFLGEQITENGVGNGISLIIFTGILSGLPGGIVTFYEYLQQGTISIIEIFLFILFAVAVIVSVVAINEGQRKVPVQYAKRVVGRKMYGGQSTNIPIRVNMAGVIPVIFASSITLFPATIATFFPDNVVSEFITNYFSWGDVATTIIYVLLIVGFTYFYTMITFNPFDIADNLKKNGGYIPGIRPGKPTSQYLARIVNRLTLFGGVFLAFVAVIPIIGGNLLGVNLQFGGTSLLIVVGVALETVKQIESQMMMRHYDGFLK